MEISNEIQNINPNELTDFSEKRNLIKSLMNLVESQSKRIDELMEENQSLRDEVNRLKGEHGDFRPRTPEVTPKVWEKKPKKKTKNKNHKKGPKNPRIKIDQIVVCEIDKSKLPEDAVFKGYREVTQQDIVFRRNNTLYRIPVYHSKKENRTYCGSFPESYNKGEFGGRLKSWIQMFHFYGDMTQGRIKAMMDNLGIYISKGTISNIILSEREMMREESAEILRAGLETVPFTQMDGTKSLESGKGKATQIISTPAYSIYNTMETKSKTDIIWALQGKRGQSTPLRYNSLAVELLGQSEVAKKDQKLLSRLITLDQDYTLSELEALLELNAPHLMKKASYPKLTETLALAYYLTQTDFPKVETLISDAGAEYAGIAPDQGLCWLHEERHYKKMIPKLKVNQITIEKVRDQIWEFYELLLIFKTLPPDQQIIQKQVLDKHFDKIFTQKTDYEDLNARLERTFSKKEKLLLVLDSPYVPLHNNDAELAIRRKVRKRDISMHTMSAEGTLAQDAFMSVIETAAKLKVNVFDYLFDRITKKFEMTSLADLVREYSYGP